MQKTQDELLFKTDLPLLELGSDFYDEVKPAQFPEQILRYKNTALGLENLKNFNWEKLWSFEPLEGNLPNALAMRYHGHQFRHYNPELGDGRGFTYAQIKKNKQFYDLGTKGSGTTPYSRNGDGRLTLKGAVREALATEMLTTYGVNTSKTACFFETGEKLIRYDEPSPTRSAVLTRFSEGHIRIGTFQRLAYFKQTSHLIKLAHYVLKIHYPEACLHIDWQNTEQIVLRFLQCTSEKLARLCAQVMTAGFVHGVLNTDNINVSGELFDYGPYRFLPKYQPEFTAAYFDQTGLYAFGQQPASFLWAYIELCKCFLSVYEQLPLQLLAENFQDQFNEAFYLSFQQKLNVRFANDEKTTEALQLFYHLQNTQILNYEDLFFYFHQTQLENNFLKTHEKTNTNLAEILKKPEAQNLLQMISSAEVINPELKKHIYYQFEKPETLLIEEIEAIWSPIADHNDWTLFNNKINLLRRIQGLNGF